MALNTTKLRSPEHYSEFKLTEMEIGVPSNEFFENSSANFVVLKLFHLRKP
jgi:hypothetical protein